MLERTKVVLVGPMFGGNVGASARAVKNTGLGGLELVAPVYGDKEEALRFSHGAEEILHGAPRHADLAAAIDGCHRVVGFTVRERHRRKILPVREFAENWVREMLTSEDPPITALLFGRERDGLSNEELDTCTDLVWIPSHPDHQSYNLAQAVLLCGYELLSASMGEDPDLPYLHPRRTKRPSPSPLASAAEREAMIAHLRAAFLAIGYAYPHTVESMARSWTEIFARARLHRREATMIRGLAHQMLWAAKQIEDRDQPTG